MRESNLRYLSAALPCLCLVFLDHKQKIVAAPWDIYLKAKESFNPYILSTVPFRKGKEKKIKQKNKIC